MQKVELACDKKTKQNKKPTPTFHLTVFFISAVWSLVFLTVSFPPHASCLKTKINENK